MLRHLYMFFLSPGGSSERIFLYYGRLDPDKKISEGGGLLREHEYINTIAMDVDEALKRLRAREFIDAKTILALQWLEMNRAALARLNDDDDEDDD